MKLIFGTSVLVAALAASVFAQNRDRPQRGPDFMMLAGRGQTIGVSVRDLDPTDATRQKIDAGVLVDDVRANGPAEKAGIKKSDVITEFDGEHVRSVRQFSRLVRETPPGKTVKATVVRDGRKTDVSITPAADERQADVFIDRDRLHDRLGELRDRLPFNFDFDFDMPGSRARLGATVEDLTPQLAAYFGAKNGVLVSSVVDNSPASRAGLKAGDVITAIDGRSLASRTDLLRTLRGINDDQELTIAIVRDKQESSLKARLERPQPRRETRRIRIGRAV